MRTRSVPSRETHPLLRQLGQQIRHLRTERGLTLQELADASALSVRFVSDIEAGHGNASILSLSQVAQALGTSLGALLSTAESVNQRQVIALLGLRGAGKSTIGPRLAQQLGLPFFELDALIEEASGLTLAEIFALHGESYYRKLELDTLQKFLSHGRSAVLATSGGIVASAEAFALLQRTCRLVWLKAPPEEHLERVMRQGDIRPMSNRPHAMAELRALLRAREPAYARAHITVDTAVLGINGSVEALVEQLSPVATSRT